MTYYEISIDKDAVTDIVLGEIFETFKETVKDNLDEDAERRIGLVDKKIVIWGGEWGTARQEEDDLENVSFAHPEHVLSFVKVSMIAAPKEVSQLENYKLQTFEAGVRVGSFRAAPVVWESDAPSYYM